ncbi:hypothetical protein [Brevibacterium paucivorans]|uniref:hypothetical protein n=1 Tax=Brevibacterium paucivorans TaxID=170994 RepID=UPI003219B1FE
MNFDKLINHADEGQLRTALHRVTRDLNYWQALLDEGMDDTSYGNGVDEVVDNITETLEKELT